MIARYGLDEARGRLPDAVQRLKARFRNAETMSQLLVPAGPGRTVKASDVAQVYQDALDTRAAAVTAKGDYRSALEARDAAEAKRLAAVDGMPIVTALL